MADAPIPGQLTKIGTVAAQNIAKALGLAEGAVQHIEQAIEDEIKVLSAHFTLAVADMRAQYETDMAKIASEFEYLKANKLKAAGVVVAVLALGALIGHFV